MKGFRRLLLIAVVGALLAWLFLRDGGPDVPEGSVLVLDVGGAYAEHAESSVVARILGQQTRPLASLLSELAKAERDERLAAVVLRIRTLEVGWGKADEIRAAIARLRESGRRSVAYLEMTSFDANLEYFVATGAEEIYAAPAALTPVLGLAAEYLFLGGLWQKLGVELEVERIGRFKTAADFLAGEKMTDAHREMANALLDSVEQRFVTGVAEGRDLEPAFVRDSIDSAPAAPGELVGLGLIDGIATQDEIVEKLGGGEVIRGRSYAGVSPESVGFDPVARFALVYGSGMVLTGEGTSTPSGAPVLASDTVSAALEDAARDPEIDAIVFRIDSPGGSSLASDIVWQAIRDARAQDKPVIASLSDVAASGGYYVASGADAIVASPATLTGSIGVFVLRPVLAGLYEKLGIRFESLTRGAHADLLIPSRPLSESSRKKLEEEVAAIYELFVKRVAEGRNLSADEVDALGRGRVWTGAQAAERQLVDGLGGLRVAVERAKERLGLDPAADVVLVPYPKPKSVLEQIEEALRTVSIDPWRAAPEPLERLGRRLEPWLALAHEGPALLPPVLVEIR